MNMLISSYNPAHVGDTLIVMLAPDTTMEQASEKKANIVRIFDEQTNATLGYNFFEISQDLALTSVGAIVLTEEQVALLNDKLQAAGFKPDLVADLTPKFVIGFVESVTPHPDSDHLQITKTQIGNGETLQIVSGSPNMQANIKVVVAKVGAMMPSGLIIWPGELRGVPSNGMIVSGRELRLPNAPQIPGALILPADFQEVGQEFNFAQAQNLFN